MSSGWAGLAGLGWAGLVPANECDSQHQEVSPCSHPSAYLLFLHTSHHRKCRKKNTEKIWAKLFNDTLTKSTEKGQIIMNYLAGKKQQGTEEAPLVSVAVTLLLTSRQRRSGRNDAADGKILMDLKFVTV